MIEFIMYVWAIFIFIVSMIFPAYVLLGIILPFIRGVDECS